MKGVGNPLSSTRDARARLTRAARASGVRTLAKQRVLYGARTSD
jgi:hypothetical protein